MGIDQGWAIGSGPPQGFIRPTCACRNYKYSLGEYRFSLKILMKINESLAKINTAVFCVLSTRHLGIITMILKKNENEDQNGVKTFFFLEITMILGEL